MPCGVSTYAPGDPAGGGKFGKTLPRALSIAGVENSPAEAGYIALLEGVEYCCGIGGVFGMAVGASPRECSDGAPNQICSDGSGAEEMLAEAGCAGTAIGPVGLCSISKCCPQILQNLPSSGFSEPQLIQYIAGLFLSDFLT